MYSYINQLVKFIFVLFLQILHIKKQFFNWILIFMKNKT